MPLDLPPLPAVDDTRRGVLTIVPCVLGGLLGLPPDHAIVDLRLSPDGDLKIEIAGADMPADGGWLPRPVKLLCHKSAGAPLELSWEHLPDKCWTLP